MRTTLKINMFGYCSVLKGYSSMTLLLSELTKRNILLLLSADLAHLLGSFHYVPVGLYFEVSRVESNYISYKCMHHFLIFITIRHFISTEI